MCSCMSANKTQAMSTSSINVPAQVTSSNGPIADGTTRLFFPPGSKMIRVDRRQNFNIGDALMALVGGTIK